MLMSLFSQSGYEGGAHMAEETTNPSKAAPRSIIFTCLSTSLAGFFYLVSLLYASGCTSVDCIDDRLTAGTYDSPVLNIFHWAFSKRRIPDGPDTSYLLGWVIFL